MQNIGILKINELAEKIPNCIRFDKGSGMFNFPEEFLPMVGDIKNKIKGHCFHYPKTGGEDILKKQILRFEESNGRQIDFDNIVVTNGGMSGIFDFLYLITQPGDEIITNQCCFEGFSLLINHFRLIQKRIDLSNVGEIKEKINRKTKAIILNSPENPTGKVYSQDEINGIIRTAKEKNIWVLSDEVMNKIIYSGAKWFGPSLDYDKVIVVNSFSKMWFLSGIRLGWITTRNYKLVKELGNLFSLQSVGVSLLPQLLMAEILEKIDFNKFISNKLEVLKSKKSILEKTLAENDLNTICNVDGGMNFYINLKGDSEEIAQQLLRNYGVAVIPGYLFEGRASNFVRVGFGAVDETEIIEGIRKISSFIKSSD